MRKMMEDARRRCRDDLWREALRKLCALDGIDLADPLHRSFYETLGAYEQALTEKNGRTTRASRTRQKIRNKGIVGCLADWALAPAPTEGFGMLIRTGRAELTGEYLLLRYPDRFSDKAVAAARGRLERAGINAPSPATVRPGV
ncbi:hypothetical protein CR492_08365 [Methylocella silvestris]|uniref:Uncharacterized protein n=2 Tax=Methylocella silvestris TaxID=199596 RepID=A0A2J7TI05_METSI|nr:hypothetical protein CR492_08365 [Methylocella silvestris]